MLSVVSGSGLSLARAGLRSLSVIGLVADCRDEFLAGEPCGLTDVLPGLPGEGTWGCCARQPVPGVS
ncbi:hypothetical protein [Acetobacter oeni]|uniref:hypothetical protein n=1 Tax=Acetobacter oeni TaxID=304077 RepID=UPI0011BFD0EA|nr:hypothetical protein [Acetobacter oeni]MBB3884097.1 hypothetical protein [Acetobacter oeni]NHO20102.1 hypothetical protein [Acetobacter oeni]